MEEVKGHVLRARSQTDVPNKHTTKVAVHYRLGGVVWSDTHTTRFTACRALWNIADVDESLCFVLCS